MHTPRISETDSARTAVTKLCEGNPGALRVLCDLFKASPVVDPGAMAGSGLAPLLLLDEWGVYGPHIWLLYKDICGEDITRMLTVMRAAQLGIILPDEILMSIKLADGPGGGYRGFINQDSLLEKVQERIPDFAKKTWQPPRS